MLQPSHSIQAPDQCSANALTSTTAPQDEAAWEALTSGGGVTLMSSEAGCPECGSRRAQVHNVLSGGTYAQERIPIQKCVCVECNHTWRVEF